MFCVLSTRILSFVKYAVPGYIILFRVIYRVRIFNMNSSDEELPKYVPPNKKNPRGKVSENVIIIWRVIFELIILQVLGR